MISVETTSSNDDHSNNVSNVSAATEGGNDDIGEVDNSAEKINAKEKSDEEEQTQRSQAIVIDLPESESSAREDEGNETVYSLELPVVYTGKT